MNKYKAQRVHAKLRAAERYGLHLNDEDLEAVVQQIQLGVGWWVETQSNQFSVWDVLVERQRCRVVYDKTRKQIATFLPRLGNSVKSE